MSDKYVKFPQYHNGTISSEEYKITVTGKNEIFFRTSKHLFLEVPCKHLKGIAVRVPNGGPLEIEIVRKSTNDIISRFLVSDDFRSDFDYKYQLAFNDILQIFVIPPQNTSKYHRFQVDVRIHHTKFKNGLDLAKSLAENKASSSRIWDQDRLSYQERRAHDPRYDPYRPPDKDE